MSDVKKVLSHTSSEFHLLFDARLLQDNFQIESFNPIINYQGKKTLSHFFLI